jgi:hypothetical protein
LLTHTETASLEAKVGEIVNAQKRNPLFDYRGKLQELDELVFEIYRITEDEKEEIRSWYERHYPRLFDATAQEA